MNKTHAGYGWSGYIKVAVVEVEAGFEGEPKMISERAKGVVRIVEEWGPCNLGKTEKSEGRIALAEATALCVRLNSVLDRIVMAIE
jgi:hypothetical protein